MAEGDTNYRVHKSWEPGCQGQRSGRGGGGRGEEGRETEGKEKEDGEGKRHGGEITGKRGKGEENGRIT